MCAFARYECASAREVGPSALLQRRYAVWWNPCLGKTHKDTFPSG
eukprot:CAMPEP_0176199782 /NCGR_PEP_ID=MMETSP0121_2-20121125/8729_1 /TAXON_ID=160619 /ORGANISM="Kryptoperidinium foliaceum, Strain CCMP 1326" /LENGTH=44 /DNA_ID= /DNA_START= /DNA_END= /DNA_ORIENTATION=